MKTTTQISSRLKIYRVGKACTESFAIGKTIPSNLKAIKWNQNHRRPFIFVIGSLILKYFLHFKVNYRKPLGRSKKKYLGIFIVKVERKTFFVPNMRLLLMFAVIVHAIHAELVLRADKKLTSCPQLVGKSGKHHWEVEQVRNMKI